MSCRAALATLDLVERQYMANARQRGEQLRAGLARLAEENTCLANVRGLGLMMAVDVVGAAGPDPARRHQLIQAAFHQGLLLLGCGQAGIRFSPALCITSGEVDTALDILGRIVD